MDIYTVRNNLKNTIAGKELLLAELEKTESPATAFVQLNLSELRAILADVEKCCEKATEDSWALNPERMGQ